MKLKKVLAVSLAASMVFGIAACGTQGETNETGTDSQAGTETGAVKG